MWVFIGITTGIVAWLFLGNVVGFDKTPWPLLLTILNLPQLSIMVSLQVSANRAQADGDRSRTASTRSWSPSSRLRRDKRGLRLPSRSLARAIVAIKQLSAMLV